MPIARRRRRHQSTGAPTSGDVYLADFNNNRIDAFDSAGHFLRAFGFGVLNGAGVLQTCTTACEGGRSGSAAGEITPAGVAVDNDPSSASFHDLYVTDTRGSRVEKFTPAGEFLLMFGKGVDQGPPIPATSAKPPTSPKATPAGPAPRARGPASSTATKTNPPPSPSMPPARSGSATSTASSGSAPTANSSPKWRSPAPA